MKEHLFKKNDYQNSELFGILMPYSQPSIPRSAVILETNILNYPNLFVKISRVEATGGGGMGLEFRQHWLEPMRLVPFT